MKTQIAFPLRSVALAAAVALMTGCAALDAREDVKEVTQDLKTAPEHKPHRTITGFSDALACMDTLMIDYGVRDVSVMVEDILDQTKKVNAGAKDMFISAVSDMTARGRSVSLSVYGADVLGARVRAWEGGRRPASAVLPQFDIKGSISQLDENVGRKQTDGAVQIGSYLGIGAAATASSSVLGLDLSVLRTDNLSVVPGVTSRNSVVIMRDGHGVDADATIKKFGINYSMSLSRSEGQAQALRNLVELASVELIGKLTRTPYWRCLGSDARHADVQGEISNWYYTLAVQPGGIQAWFQYQLRQRGDYQGPINGQDSAELREAASRYRTALGLSAEPSLDLAFFKAYLNADHAKIAAGRQEAGRTAAAMGAPKVAAAPEPAKAAAPAASPPPKAAAGAAQAAGIAPPAGPPPLQPLGSASAAPAPKPAPVVVAAAGSSSGLLAARPAAAGGPSGGSGLTLALRTEEAVLSPGKPYNVSLVTSEDAYVYCYLQDAKGEIQRFFPNRFNRDSLVRGGVPLSLPGSMPFELLADTARRAEKLACYATRQDVLSRVPPRIAGTNFQPVRAESLERVGDAYASVAGGSYAQGVLHVQAR